MEKEPDKFHGQGGSYIIEGGERKLLERTEEAKPAPAAIPDTAAPAPAAAEPTKRGK